jgi:hypothetical protein
MARKKLITLAKELDFSDESEYLNYLVDSHINGNFSQCKKLFMQMPREAKKFFLKHFDCYSSDKQIYNFYFDLL